MKLLGANPRPAVEGRGPLPGKSHYFIGSDPKEWRTDVAHYARVEYRDVYPGVSLTYYGNQSQLEYDFVVSPGGDPRRIRLGIEGAQKIHVDARGDLVLSLPGGEVVEKAPVVYQESGGTRKAIEGRFVLRGRSEVGFEVGPYDANRPLVLDPVLTYSTYLGGTDVDLGYGLAVDAAGNAYVMGATQSTNFPTRTPLQAANAGFQDIVVAKVNAAGSALVYSTYLGGSSSDFGYAIAVDASGNAYVTGQTRSTNFPTANPLQAGNNGYDDVFVTKLNGAGSALVYSTYLGGADNEQGRGIAVDPSGNAYVTGQTNSINFPRAFPLQAAFGGFWDAFVTKLNPAGSTLVYSTFLGGTEFDGAWGIAADASENAYISGITSSTNFPTANPFQAASGGLDDGFVAKVNAAGSALVYSSYFGGTDSDGSLAIALDASGNAYVTGYTSSTDLPTANPLQAAYAGGLQDAFMAKLNGPGSVLAYSTYLGGSDLELGQGIAVDASGNAYVSGVTASTNFPMVNPIQPAYGGGQYDAFASKVNAVGSALAYSTYLGGSSGEMDSRIGVDALGNAYVTGWTTSNNFPTRNPFQDLYAGGGDIFVAKIGNDPSSFFTVAPCRVADTRSPVGPSGGPALGANTTRSFPVTGLCGIPATASAIAVIVTVVDETDVGNLRLYPAGSPVPSSSTINFAVQRVRANNAIVSLGTGGRIAVQCDMSPGSTGHTHFLFDVTGYFQ